MRSIDLEKRLVSFAAQAIALTNTLNPTFANVNLSKQLIRSSSSAALNYGEARGAESKKDFLHKNQIILKELRETIIGLQLLEKLNARLGDEFKRCLQECDELVSIFVSTVNTVRSNIVGRRS